MATVTPLNPEQKNMAFQPGNGASLTKPAVLQPGPANLWNRAPAIAGVKVHPITPVRQSSARVKVNRFAFRRSNEAAAAGPPARSAGGGR